MYDMLRYVLEICTVSETDKKKILTTAIDDIRRSTKISKAEHKTQEYVRRIMAIEQTIVNDTE